MMTTERDQESGQFTASEPLYGLKGIEREAGYVHLEPEKPAEELTVAEAAEQLASRTPESEIKTYSPVGPENLALTVDEAAKIHGDQKQAEAKEAQDAADEALRKEVDELRGVKPDETTAKESTEQSAEPASEAQPTEAHAEVERLLAIPHVREAVEKLEGDYKSAATAYQQGVEVASFMTRAALADTIPDIISLPPEHQAGALAALAQREPQRYARAAAQINRANQLTALYQEQQHAKTATEEREFSQFAKTESAAFNDAIKDEPKERVREVEKAIIESIKEYGGDDAAFFELFKNTKILHSRVAQRLLYDAGQYRLMKQAVPKAMPKPVPAVQRPGVAPSKGDRAAASIAALDQKLSRSGSVNDAFALLQAKRARG